MTARVVTLDVKGNLDGTTLVEEFPAATVGPTQDDRDLGIYTIPYTGNVGFFRLATLLDAVPGFESSDVFMPQVQFQPGPNELIDLLVLGPELTGAGIRVPIMNANAGCIYAERRGGLRIRSSNQGPTNKVSFFLAPLTTQDQIIQAACCFCESTVARPCEPIEIDSVLLDPVVDPGPPPAVAEGAPFDMTLGSANATFKTTDFWLLERIAPPDGNLLIAGPAPSYTPTSISWLNIPTPAGSAGTYRLRGYRAGDPNCGITLEPFLDVK